MTDLITRLSKLDAPDREADGEIHNSLFGTEYIRVFGSITGFHISKSDNGNPPVPPYTASVDAAIALAERVLPGWKWYAGNWNVHAAVLSPDRNSDQRAVAATPAIALCIAVLKGHAAIVRIKEASSNDE